MSLIAPVFQSPFARYDYCFVDKDQTFENF